MLLNTSEPASLARRIRIRVELELLSAYCIGRRRLVNGAHRNAKIQVQNSGLLDFGDDLS